MGIKGSIVVNERMETSVPDIYAAGDAVQVKHYVTGGDALISLAGPANKQEMCIRDSVLFLDIGPIRIRIQNVRRTFLLQHFPIVSIHTLKLQLL